MTRASIFTVQKEQFWLASRQNHHYLISKQSSSFAVDKVMEAVEATGDVVSSALFQAGCAHMIHMCCLRASELLFLAYAGPRENAAVKIPSTTAGTSVCMSKSEPEIMCV